MLATNELAQTGEDTSLAVNTPSPEASSSAQHGLKSADKASYFNLILASSGLLLALLIGYLFIYHVLQDSQPEKVAANLSEIKKDKKPASGFKNEIGTEQKNKARSIYLLGKMELETQSLSAVREYFRIAVSIAPTNQEYMDAHTQVTNSIQQLSQDK